MTGEKTRESVGKLFPGDEVPPEETTTGSRTLIDALGKLIRNTAGQPAAGKPHVLDLNTIVSPSLDKTSGFIVRLRVHRTTPSLQGTDTVCLMGQNASYPFNGAVIPDKNIFKKDVFPAGSAGMQDRPPYQRSSISLLSVCRNQLSQ